MFIVDGRGDLPLWGAVLSLLEHPVRFLPTAYYHGSHDMTIDSNLSFPNMIVYKVGTSDANSPVLNTRISLS